MESLRSNLASATENWIATEPVPAALARLAAFADHDVHLLLPENDVADPEVSIVIPALNEELTIAEFVAWCQEGLAKAQVRGEILIVDSSTDSTAQKALAGGARVLVTPKRGLGRAYIDAIPFIRGKYVLLGDADLTYDFRETAPFVEKFRQGFDFIMGSRFKGHIEDGAMPGLHRYFGTPLTNWILNVLYSADFSDIHCGMRGITREALVAMDIQSQSWEYASEMVLKSVQMDLGRAEVPVRFLKDREGRVSHHKRAGWLSPWQAGWINLRSMLIHGAEFFAFRPGLWLLSVGLLITLALSQGPAERGRAYVFAVLDAARHDVEHRGFAELLFGLSLAVVPRLHGAGAGALATGVQLQSLGRVQRRRRCAGTGMSGCRWCGSISATASRFQECLAGRNIWRFWGCCC